MHWIDHPSRSTITRLVGTRPAREVNATDAAQPRIRRPSYLACAHLLHPAPMSSSSPPPQAEIMYRPFDRTPADLAHIVRLVETELSEPYTVPSSSLSRA